MKIIKLSAIDSTNSFLKKIALNTTIDDFTVVIAESQNKGRGQMHAKWFSESGKNLTFSMFCKVGALDPEHQKYLNFAVSLSVFEALQALKLPKLAIKWPNDIMSANKKVCGILIESSIKGGRIANAVIGVGLNVNQTNFPKELPNASSLKLIMNKNYNLEEVLYLIVDRLKMNINLVKENSFSELEKRYLNVLYKKNVPSMFKTAQNVLFLGKIIGVSKIGKLQIELENETVEEFDLKEVSFA
ncbi:biotin--[acetyl-CoA-carboxylase] ligase [Tenacibaculum sp. IB213877]|uniref:biotin--[acetyl-CoA-carboxylase] ligase n=1 Tax=Tenacibaculum sp. IB213877 TaxID=3097351 RepID=UPI002A5A834B|nr:biotin--[acetyl-CoA-carboxylase] ligase [Tenacibaculum sp. IB213877]MDY0781131.1 biotin--[acetyl-CoA-carboxylase] ligase [Tenacibaculum sp. IB213877]